MKKRTGRMFIYVMDAESRDTLLELGYVLLKKNKNQDVWVFINKPNHQFDSINVPYVVSDTLTF